MVGNRTSDRDESGAVRNCGIQSLFVFRGRENRVRSIPQSLVVPGGIYDRDSHRAAAVNQFSGVPTRTGSEAYANSPRSMLL